MVLVPALKLYFNTIRIFFGVYSMGEFFVITDYRKLDALVAERVLGIEVLHEYGQDYYIKTEDGGASVSSYSTDIVSAWFLVEKIRLTLKPRGGRGWWASTGTFGWVEADTAPLAICLAALKSVGIEVELRVEPVR